MCDVAENAQSCALRRSAVRKHDGTGLGLPIVQALMKLHGGTLDLESEAGQGTSVSLHFPAERSMRNGEAAIAA